MKGKLAHLCLTPELPTSITGQDQVNGVKDPRRSIKHDGAQLNSSDDAPFRSGKRERERETSDQLHSFTASQNAECVDPRCDGLAGWAGWIRMESPDVC